MEVNLMILNSDTDQATKQMLQYVIEKKRKWDNYHFAHRIMLWTSILYTLALFYLFYYSIMTPYQYSLLEMLVILTNKKSYLLIVLLAIFLFSGTTILHKKREDSEKEYHDLRCEIIDRSKDLWKGEAWKNRHHIFQMMKETYDINLYHESK
jgi:hypothetical protein